MLRYFAVPPPEINPPSRTPPLPATYPPLTPRAETPPLYPEIEVIAYINFVGRLKGVSERQCARGR